jgi:hypothetical protein
MKAKRFDAKFEKDEDVTEALDLSKARRPLQEQRRVNVDFPAWMIESLDREAGRLGVTRQSVIKVWLAERLEQIASNE